MAKLMRFSKLHSLGNDFMMIDTIQQYVNFQPELIPQWADRRKGVGFDQLLILEPPLQPDQDFYCRIYNADGSEAQNCFNGARCLGLFIRSQRLTASNRMRIGFAGGDLDLDVDYENWGAGRSCQVSLRTRAVDLYPGAPLFGGNAKSGEEIELATERVKPWLVSVGNPHAIVEWPADAPMPDLEAMGQAAQNHAWFPNGVNLSLVQRGEGEPELLKVRVYERGAGITPACGTAAMAVGALALEQQWASSPVRVAMGSGALTIARDEQGIISQVGETWMSYRAQLLIP